MRKAIILSLLLVFAIVAVSCTKQLLQQAPVQDNSQQQNAVSQQNIAQPTEPLPDTAQYVDSQFVDSNESVSIGEMV